MNDGQRSEEVNSAVEAEAISINLITQAHNEPLDVLPTDRLESEASKTTTVAYIVCPPRAAEQTQLLKTEQNQSKIYQMHETLVNYHLVNDGTKSPVSPPPAPTKADAVSSSLNTGSFLL
ncbi:hypothetical protein FBUS_09648 [Fasciolopsis buskii]|uniref:Uncharacterized protein n=1 Tax=Fasciolopsis buskii TaxID=27845 RepID=A0A8E0RMP3_9TREM|nr:hypothetical protein FBUS_09648 [Fasciolopsis buski]